ncbi:adenylate/guanylate cyclase domain-containing protein [Paucibacter sp. AS339]|uniref:ATP-binding protein n=1 Tax=Paucibacter hankyongi TaxID=3133434 RepID=UPI0030ABD460
MLRSMSQEQQQLEAAVAALEAQRPVLGNSVVETLLAPARARLAALAAPPEPPSEMEQQLKQVSILFLDVVGSTTLSQRLDPEAISAVMDDALSRGTAIVEGFHGKVLQYAGDNILAAFGVDETREDDAERAVHCGLALLELGRILGAEVLARHSHAGFNVRVGIHTGGVLLGGGVDAEGTIRGIAVNIAARMEQTAPAGALRISHDTYAQVRGLFEVDAQEPLAVKGVDAPVQSYLVRRAKPRQFRIGTRGIEGVATKMIGRDAELEALQAAYHRLFEQRTLAAVTVVAEAGIGKSRLLYEFEAWSEARPESVFLFRGRATPATGTQTFGLLRDIIAWRFQIHDDDSIEAARKKMEDGIVPLFLHDDGPDLAEGHAHLLGHLIGIEWKASRHIRGILEDPKQIRDRAHHAAAQMFRRLAAQGGAPVVLQLEDLHWADEESLDFLHYLADVNRDIPLLQLAFARPTLFERRPDWIGSNDRHERINLTVLDPLARHELGKELLQKLPEVPPMLTELIVGRAEGNPFFMEELVRMLIDQGAIDASGDTWRLQADRLQASKVPVTLTGVLQARLDSLPAPERLTLQGASVIGSVFWDRALLALDAQTEVTLPRLAQRELAVPRPDAESDGLREYSFKHALLHQVTYETVLKRQRKLLHGKLAHWLAAQSQSNSARAGDFLGLTARHFEAAGEDANAVEFHAQAAAYAHQRLAHATALAHVQAALTLLNQAGDESSQAGLRWRLMCTREKTLDLQGERECQAQDLDAMDRVAAALGDDERRSYVAFRRCIWANNLDKHAEGEQFARQSVALAESALTNAAGGPNAGADLISLREHLLISLRWLAQFMLLQGRLEEAEAVLQKALSEAKARTLLKPQAECLSGLAWVAYMRADTVLALNLLSASIDLARQLGDRQSECIVLTNLGAARAGLGNLAGGQHDAEEALRLSSQRGHRSSECANLCNLSWIALLRGDGARALDLADRALDIALAIHARLFEAVSLINSGHAQAALGQPELAAQAYVRARTVAEEIESSCRFEASAGLAKLALMRGDVGAAFNEVSTLLTPPGDTSEMAAAAVGCFDDSENAVLIELIVCQVFFAADDSRATSWLRRAYEGLMAKADTITDADMRQMFLNDIPHHRELVALWEARHKG